MTQLHDFPNLALVVVGAVFGLLFGSFLNVVIYRLPRGENLAYPPSRCPVCGAPIRPWQNIPVLSWLALRGRAACCGAPIAARYPLVELLAGGVGALLVQTRLADPSLGLLSGIGLFALYLAFGLGLIALTFIDLEFMLLPDSLTLGGIALGIATASFRGLTLVESTLWAVLGYLVIWLPFIWGYEKLRGVPGMGLGDAKLLAVAGAWFGPLGLAFTLFGGAVQGTLAFLLALLFQGKIREPEAVVAERAAFEQALAEASESERAELERERALDPLAEAPDGSLRTMRIPFGPFLALALLELLFFEPTIAALVEGTLFPE